MVVKNWKQNFGRIEFQGIKDRFNPNRCGGGNFTSPPRPHKEVGLKLCGSSENSNLSGFMLLVLPLRNGEH